MRGGNGGDGARRLFNPLIAPGLFPITVGLFERHLFEPRTASLSLRDRIRAVNFVATRHADVSKLASPRCVRTRLLLDTPRCSR